MKKCKVCGVEQEELLFPRVNRNRIKVCYSPKCRKCLNEYVRLKNPQNKEKKKAWIEKNKEKIKLKVHENYLKNREKVLERTTKWRKENKEKFKRIWKDSNEKNLNKRKARKIVDYHLRKGNLKKPESCSICNNNFNIQAHHDDYSFPLNIRWLCSQCHGIEHRKFK